MSDGFKIPFVLQMNLWLWW